MGIFVVEVKEAFKLIDVCHSWTNSGQVFQNNTLDFERLKWRS